MVLIKFHCKNKKSRDRNIRSLSLEQIINKKIEIILVMYRIQKLCLKFVLQTCILGYGKGK